MSNIEEQQSEINEVIIKKTQKIHSTRKFLSLLSWLVMSLTILTMILSLMTLFYGDDHIFEKGFSKQDIQSKLIPTIKNGGTLESVKHIYEARQFKISNNLFKSKQEDFYYSPTSLSFILNDLIVDSYQNGLYKDSIYFHNLKQILCEHERKNPFDDLEESQKNIFENLLIKLGNNYEIVQSDVSKLANEVNNQNQLVHKYLNKSTHSFIISIVALIITIVASGYQIYQAKKTNSLIKTLAYEKGKSNNGKDEEHVIS